MINVLICGANGKMGQMVVRATENLDDLQICAGYDINTEPKNNFPVYDDLSNIQEKPDVIIDFSHPALLDGLLDYACCHSIPAVICTTGLSSDQVSRIEYESKHIPIFLSANMSIGVNLLIDLVCRATKILEEQFDIEIIEKHHNQKIDAPSGTALAIADAISNTLSYPAEYVFDRHSVRKKRDHKEIGLHAVRGGTIVGEHQVLFAGTDECIELKHMATSKEVFAVGALRAAKFLTTQPAGLYSMKELIAAE